MNDLAQFGIFAGVTGYLSNMLIDVCKPMLDLWIKSHPSTAEMRTPLMKLLTLLITGFVASGVAAVAIGQGLLPADNLWLLILSSFPGAGAWYQLDSRRKGAPKNEPSEPA